MLRGNQQKRLRTSHSLLCTCVLVHTYVRDFPRVCTIMQGNWGNLCWGPWSLHTPRAYYSVSSVHNHVKVYLWQQPTAPGKTCVGHGKVSGHVHVAWLHTLIPEVLKKLQSESRAKVHMTCAFAEDTVHMIKVNESPDIRARSLLPDLIIVVEGEQNRNVDPRLPARDQISDHITR